MRRKGEMDKDDIVDYYAEDYKIESYSYKMMGKMLEKEKVILRLKKFNLQEIYIYGGGYLGVQLYLALKDTNTVKGIVDKNGGISVDIPEFIPAFTVEQLAARYKDETIIITPIRYYSQIKNSLNNLIPEDRILFLGEFLEGVV